MDTAQTAPKQDRYHARLLQYTLQSDVPGQWTDNRYNQSQHFRGISYVAIRAVYDWLGSAKICVTEPSQKRVKKALPAAGKQNQDDEYTPVSPDHPLAQLFEHINPIDTFPQFMAQWVIQLELTGNALIWTPFNANNRPAEMWILPTALCTAIPPNHQYPRGAWLVNLQQAGGYMPVMGTLGTMRAILDGREVLHDRQPHPLSRWDGYSPLTAMAREIDQYDAIQESRISAFNNGFTPDVVINLEGATSEEVDRFAAEFKNRATGSKKHRNVHITNAPKSAMTPMNPSTREMDYPQSWEQAVRASSAGFGVLTSIMGLTPADSYAAFYAGRQQMLTQKILPFSLGRGAFLTKHLARPFYGNRTRVQIDPGSVNDHELQEKQISLDVQGKAITVNEHRALRDRDPVEGGDVPAELYGQQPQMAPGMDGAQPGAAPGGGGHPLDAVGDAVLSSLGVSKPVAKALPYDEGKHKRNHGKFASKDGASGAGTTPAPGASSGAAPSAAAPTGQAGGQVPAHVANHPTVKGAAAKLAGAAAGIATKVTAGLAAAGMTPEDVVGSWDDWSRIFITHHSDVVAHALGVDALTAGHVLTHLLAGAWGKVKGILGGKQQGQPQQPQQVTTTPDRADGTDGGPPRPENTAGAGSLAPRPAVTKAFRDADLQSALDEILDSLTGERVWKAKPFEEDEHPRDHGKFASKPGAGGTATASKPKTKPSVAPAKPTGKPKRPATKVPERKPSAKAARAKASHKLIGADVQRYAEEHNEPRFAKAMGGVSFPDGEPVDVAIPGKSGKVAHGVELKTMVDNGNGKITMNKYAQVRKAVWEQAQGAVFHTVVSDDTDVKDANGPGQHDESKRRYYYRRGCAGSARIGSLHPVKNEAELKRLIEMPEEQLPPAAQRTDGALHVGTWKPIVDADGKGFENSETGEIVRPKK